ncbi:MAG: EF-hand domain-containing protein [Planctomycetaceae bacterium]
MRKLLMLGLLAAFTAGVLADTGFAAKKKKKKRTDEQIFARLDKDGDKKVTEEEFVGKRTGKKAARAKKRFSKIDKNGDGSLTLEEFKARKKKKKKKK